MRTQIVTVVLAGSLGLTGAALLSPSLASAQTPSPSSTSNPVTDSLTAIKDALKGLVSDDTITQAQADEVATALAEELPRLGRGGHGSHGPRGGRVSPEATASVLGITVEELRTQREAGKTLAQVAEAEGVSKADLVKGLVAAAEEQLAADVAAGELTQAEADERKAGLTERITAKVDQVGGGRGGRGHHHGPRDGGDDDAATVPSPSPTA